MDRQWTHPVALRKHKAYCSPDEVNTWLEWGGKTLLSIGSRRPGPGNPRIAWPDFPHDPMDAFGWERERLRIMPPASDAIPIMDDIMALPMLVENISIRRLVQARALIAPINGRHLYTWVKLGKLIHSNRKTVVRLHRVGLEQIAAQAELIVVCRIAHFLAQVPLSS
jgi:hypothetical protein